MALKTSQILAFTTIGLLAVRWYAARLVGFGDSEALYATYATHPQAAYLDHPGLIGALASSLGGGTAPSPEVAHIVTGALATAFPLLVLFVARRMGATPDRAAIAALVVAVTPEMAVGLFAMTPDLLLAYVWLAFLGTCALALEAEASSARATVLFLMAGVLAGVAATAKVTGALLMPAYLVVVARSERHRRTPWPWLGAGAGVLPIAALVRFEASKGFPMLHHRLVDTQAGSGLSLRNLGALLGGQLLYLSPVIAVLAVLVVRDLVRQRDTAPLLFWTFVLPIVPLVVLCLWSRTAEPHWLAPPLLALPLFAAQHPPSVSRKLVIGGLASAAALSVAVYVWVVDPDLLHFAPKRYDSKVDITNELFGWKQASRAADEMQRDVALGGSGADVWLVGPSWMVCAQLAAALPLANVGCSTDKPTDFDDWASPARWRRADAIVFVTDDRMRVDPETLLPAFHTERSSHVTILRGGRVVRVFQLTLLEKRAGA